MKRLKCIYSSRPDCFTEGADYSAHDSLNHIVGNDLNVLEPWELESLEVKVSAGVIARFEEITQPNIS